MSRPRSRGAGLAAFALLAGPALAAPQRICSLSLAGDELLAILVSPERVVCVSNLVDDPELSNAVGRFPRTIPRLTAQIEPVLAARPDLVLVAPWNEQSFSEILTRTGIATHRLSEASTFAAIVHETLALGRRLGESARAEAIAHDLEQRLAALDRRLARAATKPRVLSFSHLIVAGVGTTADEVIRRAGGANAAAELDLRGHRQVPLERLIALDPDWLVLGFDAGESRERILEAHPLLKLTRAARSGRVLVLPPKRLTAVSPFLIDGVEELAHALHPGVFAAGAAAP